VWTASGSAPDNLNEQERPKLRAAANQMVEARCLSTILRRANLMDMHANCGS